MRRIWALCCLEILRVFKKPSSYALMFGMPIIFTFIFGSLLGEPSEITKIRLALIDQDQSTVSRQIVQQLKNDPMLEISELQYDKAEKELENKKIRGMILLPGGLEQHMLKNEEVKVEFQHGPDLSIAPSIRHVIDQALAQTGIQIKASQVWSRYSHETEWNKMYDKLAAVDATKLVHIETKSISKNKETKGMNNLSSRAIGFSIMFLMITLLSVTGTILDARKQGVWYRMLVTPSSRLEVIGGYLLSFFVIGWLQFGILMLFSSLLFDVEWGNIPGVALLVSSLLLCVVGLGLMVAGFVRTTEQQSALGTIVIVSTCMLGGIYWPLDVVPQFMQKIANFVPQTWAMRGFTELVARGGSIPDILVPVSILLGFAAIFLTLGLSRIRFE